MSQDLKIVQSQLIFEFKNNPNIRKRVFEFEDVLKDYFKVPYKTYALPDDFNDSVARFESSSTNGHSILQATPTRLALVTNYDEKFNKSVKDIKSYINERVGLFKKLLIPENKLTVAFIVEVAYKMEQEKINEFLKKHSNANAVNNDTIDFQLTYSYPFSKKYYVNIKIAKYQLESVIMSSTGGIIERTGKIEEYGISLTIDINSKLHIAQGNSFEDSVVEDILQTTFTVIEKNNLENYLLGDIKYE